MTTKKTVDARRGSRTACQGDLWNYTGLCKPTVGRGRSSEKHENSMSPCMTPTSFLKTIPHFYDKRGIRKKISTARNSLDIYPIGYIMRSERSGHNELSLDHLA